MESGGGPGLLSQLGMSHEQMFKHYLAIRLRDNSQGKVVGALLATILGLDKSIGKVRVLRKMVYIVCSEFKLYLPMEFSM